jgi:osmotically-inducible protein OsmY
MLRDCLAARQLANTSMTRRSTTKVKAAMFDDPSVKVMQIGVETMQNVVQLSGFVDFAQTKARARELARSVKSVREVRNDLVVR